MDKKCLRINPTLIYLSLLLEPDCICYWTSRPIFCQQYIQYQTDAWLGTSIPVLRYRLYKMMCWSWRWNRQNSTSSTFCDVLADASRNKRSFSFANCSPSSLLTALRWERSLLFPTSMIVMFGLACWRASSSHPARWLNVSLLRLSSHTTVVIIHNGILSYLCKLGL